MFKFLCTSNSNFRGRIFYGPSPAWGLFVWDPPLYSHSFLPRRSKAWVQTCPLVWQSCSWAGSGEPLGSISGAQIPVSDAFELLLGGATTAGLLLATRPRLPSLGQLLTLVWNIGSKSCFFLTLMKQTNGKNLYIVLVFYLFCFSFFRDRAEAFYRAILVPNLCRHGLSLVCRLKCQPRAISDHSWTLLSFTAHPFLGLHWQTWAMNLPVLSYGGPALFFFLNFFVSFLYQNFLAALAGWQSSVWLFLYNFLNSDLLFSTWRRCFVSRSLSASLNPVDSFPMPGLLQGENSPCLSILWWEQGVFVWAGIVPVTLPGVFVHWPVNENWRELAKIESFCHFLAVPPNPVMCISVLAQILGHVLKWFHFELEIHGVFFWETETFKYDK